MDRLQRGVGIALCMAATMFHPMPSAPGTEAMEVAERDVYSSFKVMGSYESVMSFRGGRMKSGGRPRG